MEDLVKTNKQLKAEWDKRRVGLLGNVRDLLLNGEHCISFSFQGEDSDSSKDEDEEQGEKGRASASAAESERRQKGQETSSTGFAICSVRRTRAMPLSGPSGITDSGNASRSRAVLGVCPVHKSCAESQSVSRGSKAGTDARHRCGAKRKWEGYSRRALRGSRGHFGCARCARRRASASLAARIGRVDRREWCRRSTSTMSRGLKESD